MQTLEPPRALATSTRPVSGSSGNLIASESPVPGTGLHPASLPVPLASSLRRLVVPNWNLVAGQHRPPFFRAGPDRDRVSTGYQRIQANVQGGDAGHRLCHHRLEIIGWCRPEVAARSRIDTDLDQFGCPDDCHLNRGLIVICNQRGETRNVGPALLAKIEQDFPIPPHDDLDSLAARLCRLEK